MSQSAQPRAPQSPPAGTDGEPGTKPFSWRFTTPLFIGSALNPINSSLIATALVPIAGIAGFAVAMTALLMFLFSLPGPDWVMLGVTIAAWIALVAWELRARSPFFDVRLLASNLALTRTYLRFALVLLCVYIVLYGITQWLEAGRGFSAISTGLLLLPMTLISGLIIAPISRRNLVKGPVIAAAIACLAGSAGVLFLGSSTSIVWIIAITLAFGIAMGAGASGNQTALYTQAPADQLGTASGLLRTFGYVGSIASSAITGIVFHNGVSDHGLHTIGWIMVGVSAVLVLVTLADRTLRGPGQSPG